MSDYPLWADVPHDQHYFEWEKIPEAIASFQHPDDQAGLARAIAEDGIRRHLRRWIFEGLVTVRDAVSFLPVDGNLPITGGVFNRADLERFSNECGVGLRISPPALQQAPRGAEVEPLAVPTIGVQVEEKIDRQDRRLSACEAAGLTMPTGDYDHLPPGVGVLAKREGVSRQAFSQDVKAALRRRNERRRNGLNR